MPISAPDLPCIPSIIDALTDVPDPRQRACPYPLNELLFVALCGICSGANNWVGVTDWARIQLEWLRRYLPFANGIASHDTFSRVFSLLDPLQFEALFVRWMQSLCPALAGASIAIDGKSLRRSHDGAKPMAHLVSAWNQAHGLTLGQVKASEKSNEITAIPKLLDALQIQGAIITIDAAGCQHAIAEAIIDKQADYILALKNNQPKLAQAVEQLFDSHDRGALAQPLEQVTDVDKGHGRVETRCCTVASDLSSLGEVAEHWRGLRSVIRVMSTREIVNGKDKGKSSTALRYYISSTTLSAARFQETVRGHWSIENSCHWVLDMTFREDECRIRVGDGAENFAILRRMSLGLIKQEKSTKTSVNIKRLKMGWSPKYLGTVLGLVGR